MKKFMKCFSKSLAILLSVLTIISVMPMQTFATDYQNYITLTSVEEPVEKELLIQEEVVEERTANSKTYLLTDGTYCELTFSYAIHSYENNTWENLNESLNETIPETIDEATTNLSIVTTTYSSVDDGYVVESGDTPISIWGISATEPLTTGYVSFVYDDDDSEGYVGVLKCSIADKPLYEKTEVTINADIRLSCNSVGEENTIAVKPIYRSWSEETISYNDFINDFSPPEGEELVDLPTIDYNAIDSVGRYKWDITSEYIKWENGTQPNYGLYLMSDAENITISSGILRRHYRVIDDNDLGFTYHNVDMGRAGILYINDYTNVPYLERSEISIDGNNMPVSITRFITSALSSSSIGAGGRWNYESTLTYSANTYTWNMFNGSSARFQRSSSGETDSEGRERWDEYQYNSQGYTLWIDTEKSRDYDYSNNIIIDNEGYIYTFNYYGYVNYIKHNNNAEDTIAISYDGETIKSITDATGHRYKFIYSSLNNLYDVVEKIKAVYVTTIYDDEGNAQETETDIKITTTALDDEGKSIKANLEISFNYEIVNNSIHLTKVTYPDSQVVEYSYDALGRLLTIKNIDKSILTLSYAISTEVDTIYNNPSFINRISSYSKKVLNEQGEYTNEYTVSIDAQNSYTRYFKQDFSGNNNAYTETIQFNRNLDVLYYTDSSDNSYFADYDNSHQLISLVIPEDKSSNIITNSKMQKRATSSYPKSWDKGSLSADYFVTQDTAGKHYIEFKNSFSNELLLSQTHNSKCTTCPFQGESGEKYVITAWGKGNATIPKEENFWGIRIFAKNSEGEEKLIHTMSFDTSLWNKEQIRATAFSLPFSTDSITVQLVSSNQLGTVGFDDVYLYKTESAYVASDNNVESVRTCVCEGCEYVNCTCAHKDTDSCDCISCNIKTTNEKVDDKEIITTTNGSKSLISQYKYTSDLNYPLQYIDENNVSTSYEYSLTNGLLLSETFDSDSKVSYGYDAIGMLTSVSQTVTNVINENQVNMNTTYSYENDKISSITHNGFSYNYEYDAYGNLKTFSLENSPLITYSYNNDYYKSLGSITYENGLTITYSYDNRGNITGISHDGGNTETYSYEYDEYNNLVSYTDYINHTITSYNKTINEIDYAVVVQRIDDGSIVYGNVENSINSYTETIFGKSYSIINKTDYAPKDGYTIPTQTTPVMLSDNEITASISSVIDSLNRRIEDNFALLNKKFDDNSVNEYDSLTVKNEYTYKDAQLNQTTNLVDTFKVTLVTSHYSKDSSGKEIVTAINEEEQLNLEYKYDSAGRITAINQYRNDSDFIGYYPIAIYQYDEAGQLIVECVDENMVWSYTYDAGGNLTSKNFHENPQFELVNGTPVLKDIGPHTASKTITYEYKNACKDLLTSYNGHAIRYDEIGNPLNYYGLSTNGEEINVNLEWTGRLLTAAVSEDGKNKYEYTYDASGLRTGKTIFQKETYTVLSTDENGNIASQEYTDFIKSAHIEYVWADGVIVGYQTTAFTPIEDADGNYSIDSNGKVITEASNSIIIRPLYNEFNEPLGVNCYSTTEEEAETFYFVKDAQGNVRSIYSLENDYTIDLNYDAFGNISLGISGAPIDNIQNSITNANGEFAQVIAAILGGIAIAAIISITFTSSPYAYRGYVYDIETGLYYCQSRYYSPSWGRFITADDPSILEMTVGDVRSANLFAYCNNDPINYIDPNGYYFISLKNLTKMFLAIGLLNPVSYALVTSLAAVLKIKYSLFITKISVFWGTVIKWTFRAVALIVGLPLMSQFATAIIDCVAQGLKGIEITIKKSKRGIPYGFSIFASDGA